MKRIILISQLLFAFCTMLYAGKLDGREYIDLGLPSGTLWATCNVGANSPEEYGDYFAWGETKPKSNYTWANYNYGTDSRQLTKYCDVSEYGKNVFADIKKVLDSEDDAATVNCGSDWRMPSMEELEELYTRCSSVWTVQNGVEGRLFTRMNGNTLFLPAAGRYNGDNLDYVGRNGYYLSNSLATSIPNHMCVLIIDSHQVGWFYYRYYGQSVRPVFIGERSASQKTHRVQLQKVQPKEESKPLKTKQEQVKPVQPKKPALTK